MGLLAGVALAVAAGPASAADVVGTWATEAEKSHVEIKPCVAQPGELCGTIVWLKEPLNEAGAPKADRNNPAPALQDRPIIGLPLLSGFTRSAAEPNTWDGGEIYNPEDGKTYTARMELLDDGRLEVRGYVGLPLFGKSQIWTPVKAD